MNLQTCRELRWGLIGCGDIVRKRVAAALQQVPGSRLAALARKDAARVEQAAREFGIERWFESADDLIKSPEIDAVYLATPVNRHLPDTLLAAEHGKHVLCEKPMALNPAECQQMIDATRNAGVTFGVAYYRRFYPIVQTVRDYLARGTLGRIVSVDFRVHDLHDPTGNLAGREWFLDPRQAGGGCIMDFGCHRLDLCVYLFGRPDSMWGSIDTVRFQAPVEDRALVVLYYANGPEVAIHLSSAIDQPCDTFHIFGTAGAAAVPDLNQELMEVTLDSRTAPLNLAPHANLHYPLVEDFCAAVREQRDPRCPGESALITNQIIDAIYSYQGA